MSEHHKDSLVLQQRMALLIEAVCMQILKLLIGANVVITTAMHKRSWKKHYFLVEKNL